MLQNSENFEKQRKTVPSERNSYGGGLPIVFHLIQCIAIKETYYSLTIIWWAPALQPPVPTGLEDESLLCRHFFQGL